MSTRRGAGDRGSVTIFFAVAVIALLLGLGLVVDGGAKVRGLQRADDLAAEAARAGGQAINTPAAITGASPYLDPGTAVRSAQAYLHANAVTGTVSIIDGGRAVRVDVTTGTDTVFLALIGIHTMTTTGTAQASLVRGVTGAGT